MVKDGQCFSKGQAFFVFLSEGLNWSENLKCGLKVADLNNYDINFVKHPKPLFYFRIKIILSFPHTVTMHSRLGR